MATVAQLVIVGTPDNDDLVAIPTRPWTNRDDNNTMQGLGGDDLLSAGGGDDRFDGGPGDDRLDGGSGTDTAVFPQPRQAYQVFRYDLAGLGREAVVRGPDGIDSTLSVEFLEFRPPSGAPDLVPLESFPAFPALDYVASYPDLASTFGANQNLAWFHFRDFGAREERTVTFDGLDYIASYPDLSAAFGTDAAQAARHYLVHGRTEGRAVTFDGLQYVAGNADLAAAFAPLRSPEAIDDAGAAHFIVYGRAEGRFPDTFDEAEYLANYPDLAAAGLETPDQLALHYIAFGRAEGRTDKAPAAAPGPIEAPAPSVPIGAELIA